MLRTVLQCVLDQIADQDCVGIRIDMKERRRLGKNQIDPPCIAGTCMSVVRTFGTDRGVN